jgi:hypothetical protein
METIELKTAIPWVQLSHSSRELSLEMFISESHHEENAASFCTFRKL